MPRMRQGIEEFNNDRVFFAVEEWAGYFGVGPFKEGEERFDVELAKPKSNGG